MDSDQARHAVGPDLDPDCLQMLSADDSSRQRVNARNLISPNKERNHLSTGLNVYYNYYG